MAEATDAQVPIEEPTVDGEIVDLRPRESGEAEFREFAERNLLNNDKLLREMHQVAQKAESISTNQLAQMTEEDFAETIGARSLEAQMAFADQQATYAKYGLKPFDTVDGLIALRQALVVAYRDSSIVPAEMRLRVAELDRDIAIVEARRAILVEVEGARARTTLTEVSLAEAISNLQSGNSLQIAAMQEEVRLLKARLGVKDAAADGVLAEVRIKGKHETARIDDSLLRKEKRLEYRRKFFDLSAEERKVVVRGVIKPIRRFAIAVLVPLILLANLVADGPNRGDTPILGAVNGTWDAIYNPVRDGVLRVYHQFADD